MCAVEGFCGVDRFVEYVEFIGFVGFVGFLEKKGVVLLLGRSF